MESQEAALSVVVGTYNRLDQLRQCVTSIFQQTTTPLHLFVTDAGSTDGTVSYLRELSTANPRVTALLTGQKVGQARALNQVFPLVKTEFVCWLSDDNIVVNRGLDLAVDILRRQPRLGMVGLKVKDVRGPWIEAPYIGGISPLGLLNVNQGFLRTRILHDLGGFSEDYLDYGIDPDLTARVLLAGWDIAFTRQIVIHHYREWMTADAAEVVRRKERHRRAVEVYLDKYAKLSRQRQWQLALKKKIFDWTNLLLHRLFADVSKKTFFGQPYRDWYNVCHGRYISLWDMIRCWKKPYHLVQRVPRRKAG